ncbi:TldD/PmbA family protein [Thermosulfurimonas marina]|uniref:TldD/PmbA family protein n=1 Tax=Thermosulfurimonas marina TaxID=2047767 RepID=UPI00144A9FFD|nr:metallopeptidase TldD-related protein [Thermosulfurimonas marina]
MDLKNLGEVVEEFSRRKGVWGELWGELSRGLTLERRDGRPHALEPWREVSLAVRIVRKGRAGLSYTTQAKPEAVRRAAERAYEAACFSEEEAVIPEGETLPDLPSFSSEAFPSPEELEADLISAEEAARAAFPEVHRLERAVLSCGEESLFIFQTRGISATFSRPSWSFLLSLVARRGEEERTGWEWREVVRREDLSPEVLARRAAEKAVALLGAEKGPSRRLAGLFPPEAAVALLETLSFSFCGDEVAKGRSRLAGKLGQRIFSEKLTLIDDGLYPRGLESRPFDDEGFPQKRTILLDQGTVAAFLYDGLWGRRAGKASTGNARRPSFKALPRIAPTNLYLVPGESPLEDLRSAEPVFEVREILGWHTADPISGDFSVGVSGLLYQGGQRRPLSGMALSGNLFELLSRVEALGNDLTFYGSLGAPSLFIPDLDLAGS